MCIDHELINRMQVEQLRTCGGNTRHVVVALRSLATLWKHTANRQYLVTDECTKALVHSAQQHTGSAKIQIRVAQLVLAFAQDARWRSVADNFAPVCACTLHAARSQHPRDRGVVAAVDAALWTLLSKYPHAALPLPLVSPAASTCVLSDAPPYMALPSPSGSVPLHRDHFDGCKHAVPVSAPQKATRSLSLRYARQNWSVVDTTYSSSSPQQLSLTRRLLGSWRSSLPM